MGRSDSAAAGRVGPNEEFAAMGTTQAGPGKVSWSVEPVTREETLQAMAVLAQARWHWPYLARTLSTAKNGRETGTFIAGHVYAMATHGELGLRVEVLDDQLAAISAVLVASGLCVCLHSGAPAEDGQPKRVTIDCWIEHGGEMNAQ